MMLPTILSYFSNNSLDINYSRSNLFLFGISLILLSIIVAFICQLGDLFISFLKRKAKVKDTGNLLPGHGGLLDRVDGIIFALPFGIIFWEFLIFLS